MNPNLLDPILHTVIALALLGAYCALWAMGHQDTTLLGILGGQLGALGVSQVAQKATEAGVAAPKPQSSQAPTPPPIA